MSLSIPSQIFSEARKHSEVFVETGTHEGGGVLGALMAGFRKVFTCDIDIEMVRKAKLNCGHHWGRVQYYVGDSAHRLGEMLADAGTGPVVVLLDAHPMNESVLNHTPLEAELYAIHLHMHPALVIVDDFDILPRAQAQSVVDRLLSIRPSWPISVHNGLTRHKSILVSSPTEFRP